MTFDVREEAVGVSLADSTAKQGVGESVGRSGEVLEDDYGIAVDPDHFKDLATGVDSAKLAGSGRIGEETLRRAGFGFASQGARSGAPSARGGLPAPEQKATQVSCVYVVNRIRLDRGLRVFVLNYRALTLILAD